MSGETVLQHARESKTEFLIYTGDFCGYCTAAKRLLDSSSLTYTEYNFDEHSGLRKSVVDETWHRTVPVILDISNEQPIFIGGFDQLQPYLRKRS